MFKRDYLMRQFDLLALVLGRVLQLLKERKPAEALQAIDEEIERLSGLDAYTLSHLTHNDLITGPAVGETAAESRARRLVLAALLARAGEIYAAQEDEEAAYRCTLGALDLCLETDTGEESEPLPPEIPTVADLVTALDGYALPPAIHLRLFRYYEMNGDYADAEDLLFEMLDAEADSPELQTLAVEFYRRLLTYSDDALEAGNLPRAEVEAGLAESEGRGSRRE